MSYRVFISPSVKRKIAKWSLSDSVLVDVYLFLQDLLTDNPAAVLRRTSQPFDGMVLDFAMIDPEDRLREHIFCFLVRYHSDEETLLITNAGYWRRDGM